jgi:hypothetical protein
MKSLAKYSLKVAALVALPLVFAGCGTVGDVLNSPSANVVALQQAVDANHKATIAVLNQMNSEMLPYRIQDVINQRDPAYIDSFGKSDFNVIDPADIAAWDTLLTSLDSYCGALASLSSGQQAKDFVSSADGLGSNITALAKAAKVTTNANLNVVEGALVAIGSVVINAKANEDIQSITSKADPDFQKVTEILISTLGVQFGTDGKPVPAAHSILGDYEDAYITHNAKQLKDFKGDTIQFGSASADVRKQQIQELRDWITIEADHDKFVESATQLATALKKAAAAHKALADPSKLSIADAYKDLQVQIKNAQTIYQSFKKG